MPFAGQLRYFRSWQPAEGHLYFLVQEHAKLTHVWGTPCEDNCDEKDFYSLWTGDGNSFTLLLDNLESWSLSHLTTMGGCLYFAKGNALWRSDGTAEGTKEILVNVVIPADDPSQPFLVLGDTMYFDAFFKPGGTELWMSDGTPAGTVPVADLATGVNSSIPQNLAAAGTDIFFTTQTDANDTLLWKSDGTTAGTVSIASFSSANGKGPRLQNFRQFSHRLYFQVNDKLWMHKDGVTKQVEETASLKVLHFHQAMK